MLDEPYLDRGEEFFITAFYQLSSCRSFADAAPGPIPWDKIVQYADRRGLDLEMGQAFEHIMRIIDSKYTEWYIKKLKAKSPKGR